MPAEWEPHHATWVVWPHARADWEVKTATVEWCYADIVPAPCARGARSDCLQRRGRAAAGRAAPAADGCRPRAHRRPRHTDGPLMDSGLRADLRRPRKGRPAHGRGDRLALQRLGPLPLLGTRRCAAARDCRATRHAALRGRRGRRRWPAARGSRRRQCRRERRGPAVDDRGVPAGPRPGAEPGTVTFRARRRAAADARDRAGAVAGRGHRR